MAGWGRPASTHSRHCGKEATKSQEKSAPSRAAAAAEQRHSLQVLLWLRVRPWKTQGFYCSPRQPARGEGRQLLRATDLSSGIVLSSIHEPSGCEAAAAMHQHELGREDGGAQAQGETRYA